VWPTRGPAPPSRRKPCWIDRRYEGSPRPGRARQRPNGPPMRRVVDERGQALEPGLFPLGADDPPDRGPAVRRSLGLEEVPGFLVGAKSLLVLLTKRSGSPLLVRVGPRPLRRARLERAEPYGTHQPQAR